MNQDKMLTIMEARASQSGKTLGVKANDGIWYTTKCWDLQAMIGQAIMADTSQSEFNGKTMNWINDYKTPGQPMPSGPGVELPVPVFDPGASPGMGQAHSITPPAPATPATPATVNRDASIVAQTLCKSITFSDAQTAFSTYCALYDMYEVWSNPAPAANQAMQDAQAIADDFPGAQAAPFNDDIPF